MSAGDSAQLSPAQLSPSQRYAASRRRTAYPRLTEFRAQYSFPLDGFQVEAGEALEDGYGVLVCAPTGAGKTVVGEFAVHLALVAGEKCFYTTPIKALSNQKYADLVARHGAANVGAAGELDLRAHGGRVSASGGSTNGPFVPARRGVRS